MCALIFVLIRMRNRDLRWSDWTRASRSWFGKRLDLRFTHSVELISTNNTGSAGWYRYLLAGYIVLDAYSATGRVDPVSRAGSSPGIELRRDDINETARDDYRDGYLTSRSPILPIVGAKIRYRGLK